MGGPRRGDRAHEQIHSLLRLHARHAEHAELVRAGEPHRRRVVGGRRDPVGDHLDALAAISKPGERLDLPLRHRDDAVDARRREARQAALVGPHRKQLAVGGERRMLVDHVRRPRSPRDRFARQQPAHAARDDGVRPRARVAERAPPAARIRAPTHVQADRRHPSAGERAVQGPLAGQAHHPHLRPACGEQWDERGPVALGASGAHVGTHEQQAHQARRCTASVSPARAPGRWGWSARKLAASSSRRRGSIRSRRSADLWRTARTSTTPRRQPRCAASAAQCRSSPQPKRSSGNGSSSARNGAAERGERADLYEARLAHERQRPPARGLPGRVRAQRLRGLRQVELESARRARRNGRGSAARGARSSSTTSSQSKSEIPAAGHHAVQVLELAPVEPGGDGLLGEQRIGLVRRRPGRTGPGAAATAGCRAPLPAGTPADRSR